MVLVDEERQAVLENEVNVWYHVGSKNEKVGRTGFAHLFEHLMFNGSEHFNEPALKQLNLGEIRLLDENGKPVGK